MQFTEIKKQIEFMMQENYEDFIKAFISIELGIEDKNVLNKVYNKYMENDDVILLMTIFLILLMKFELYNHLSESKHLMHNINNLK